MRIETFKFNPHKSIDGDGNTNGERAERSYRTLLVYAQRLGGSSRVDDDIIRDFLTDLRHLCDESGYDFADACEWSGLRHEEER